MGLRSGLVACRPYITEEWSKYVLKELERLNDSCERITDDLDKIRVVR